MFNPREAFSKISGREYNSSQELREAIRGLMVDHYRQIPADYTMHDLYIVAVRNNWLTREAGGRYAIHVPRQAESALEAIGV